MLRRAAKTAIRPRQTTTPLLPCTTTCVRSRSLTPASSIRYQHHIAGSTSGSRQDLGLQDRRNASLSSIVAPARPGSSSATLFKRFNTTEAASTSPVGSDISVSASSPSVAEDKAVKLALKKAVRRQRRATRKAAEEAEAATATAVARIDSPMHDINSLTDESAAALLKPGRKQRRALLAKLRVGVHSRTSPATDQTNSSSDYIKLLANGDNDDEQRPVVRETISRPIQILCDAMREAKVTRVRDLPPVFLASTPEQADQAMELFTEYYKTVNGSSGPGPVGFDTETTTGFLPRSGHGVSLVQIATDDVCVMFQVYRITNNNTRRDLFPSRLKQFLRDPEQLLVGVAANGDGKVLKMSYGVECAGIVNLEFLAQKKNILARSLQQLDEMFGRPGREVIKTKALLGWNWDSETLDPKWVWYAAKDAFAGLAIYNNMRKNRYNPGYVPFARQQPMTEAEQEADFFEHIYRYMGGKGTKSNVGILKEIALEGYARFHRLYQPTERAIQVDKYLRRFIESGRLTLVGGKDLTDLEGSTLDLDLEVGIPGRRLSSLITTPEGVAVLSPYFNNRTIDLSTLRKRGISIPSIEYPEERVDQDMIDLRQFLENAWIWNRPRRRENVFSMYTASWTTAMGRIKREQPQFTTTLFVTGVKKMRDLLDMKAGENMKEREDVKDREDTKDWGEGDQETLTEITLRGPLFPNRFESERFLGGFIRRLMNRGLLIIRNNVVMVNPEIEEKCLAVVPQWSPTLDDQSTQPSLTEEWVSDHHEDEDNTNFVKDTTDDDNVGDGDGDGETTASVPDRSKEAELVMEKDLREDIDGIQLNKEDESKPKEIEITTREDEVKLNEVKTQEDDFSLPKAETP